MWPSDLSGGPRSTGCESPRGERRSLSRRHLSQRLPLNQGVNAQSMGQWGAQHRPKGQDKAVSGGSMGVETTWNFPGGSNGVEADRGVERIRVQSGSISSGTG